MIPRLVDDGVFYSTFFEGPDSRLYIGPPHPWRKGETNCSRYPFAFFAELARIENLSIKYLGDWGHPRGQKMLAFGKLR